MQTHVKT
ncbi:glycerophosphoryl diester phosphodiesterase, partial [Yersinia pestis PY-03]